MAEIKLKAETGRPLGTRPSRRVRAEGKVPGVVYGLGADPVSVAVEWKPLRAALTTDAGLNALIDLDVDGDVALTIVKELQRHPLRGDVLHVDFLRVSADAAISVEVPIVLEGEAREVANADGTIDQLLFNLTVNAKPADIPNELRIDVSELTVGDAIRVGDLTLPAGSRTEMDPEEVLVSAVHSTVAEEAEAISEADAEAGAEAGAEPSEGAESSEGEGDAGGSEGAES